MIDGPEFAVSTRRAIGGDLRPLAVIGILGDEGEPALADVGEATAFLAAQHGAQHHRTAEPTQCPDHRLGRVLRTTAPGRNVERPIDE